MPDFRYTNGLPAMTVATTCIGVRIKKWQEKGPDTSNSLVGGTYFPPEDKYGRPGFKTVLHKVSEAWRKDKQALISQGTRVLSSIAEAITSQGRCFSHFAKLTRLQGIKVLFVQCLLKLEPSKSMPRQHELQ